MQGREGGGLCELCRGTSERPGCRRRRSPGTHEYSWPVTSVAGWLPTFPPVHVEPAQTKGGDSAVSPGSRFAQGSELPLCFF